MRWGQWWLWIWWWWWWCLCCWWPWQWCWRWCWLWGQMDGSDWWAGCWTCLISSALPQINNGIQADQGPGRFLRTLPGIKCIKESKKAHDVPLAHLTPHHTPLAHHLSFFTAMCTKIWRYRDACWVMSVTQDFGSLSQMLSRLTQTFWTVSGTFCLKRHQCFSEPMLALFIKCFFIFFYFINVFWLVYEWVMRPDFSILTDKQRFQATLD